MHKTLGQRGIHDWAVSEDQAYSMRYEDWLL